MTGPPKQGHSPRRRSSPRKRRPMLRTCATRDDPRRGSKQADSTEQQDTVRPAPSHPWSTIVSTA